MLRLRVLGQADLRDRDDREVAAVLVQPKRLALLTYLAMTTASGFQRRDLLLSLFWPEQSPERARNALRQALHQLRRALGKEVVVSRGADAIAVDGSQLWCDANAFDAALARGSLEEALALYGGDLLPGFAVDGAPSFDHWLEDTRAALRGRATRAAWSLAAQQERAGNAVAAADSARRAWALALDDEAGLRHLMKLLDRLGDQGGALDAYAGFAHRLERDSGARPALETKALVEAIRTRPGSAATGSSIAHPSAPPGRERVTITTFQNLTGDDASDFIGRLVCDAIVQGIVESRMVDHVATNVSAENGNGGAEFTVTGSYFLSDATWRFRAKVTDGAGGRVLDTIGEVTAPMERPWEAAEELRRRITGSLAGRLDHRFASWANAVVQAPNLEAHRELALGAELHLRGDFREAIPHLLRAGDPKEGFALPLLWAIQASCNLEEWEQAEAILAELSAPRHRPRLSTFEKLGCDYLAACLAGQRGSALRITRTAAEMVPDSEVLSQLGREALFCNYPREAVEALERLKPDRGWIPAWTPHWRRLTEAYHLLGDHTRELDAARRGRLHHPEAITALLYEARALAAVGDVAAVERCVDDACAFPPDRFADAGDVMLECARELRIHGRPVDAVPLTERAIAWYADNDTVCKSPMRKRYTVARGLYELDRWDEAGVIVRELLGAAPEEIDLIGLAGAIAARQGGTEDARASMTQLKTKTGKFRFGSQFVWIARIRAILGEPEPAVAALRGALARGFCYGVELHTDADLALLNGFEPFRELLRPKG